MKIKFTKAPYHAKYVCVVCGAFDYLEGKDFFTETEAYVCSRCVWAGEEYIRTQLRQQAEHHRQMAECLELLADDEIVFPDLGEVMAEQATEELTRINRDDPAL